MDRYFEVAPAVTPPAAPAASAGYASNGNPGTGAPATEPGEWFFHMMTEELRAVITAANLAPNHADTTQLLQAVRALSGNRSGVASITATGTLLAADAGKGISVACVLASQTVSLPAASTVPAGGSYYLYNRGLAYALARTGTDTLSADGSAKTSFLIPTGGIVEAVSNGVNGWSVGGTGLNSQVGDLFASLAASGYQKLPSGLIIQWGSGFAAIGGSSINFPIAFPTAAFCVVAGGGNDNDVAVTAYTFTLTNFTANAISGSGGPYNFFYFAAGH